MNEDLAKGHQCKRQKSRQLDEDKGYSLGHRHLLPEGTPLPTCRLRILQPGPHRPTE